MDMGMDKYRYRYRIFLISRYCFSSQGQNTGLLALSRNLNKFNTPPSPQNNNFFKNFKMAASASNLLLN